MLRATLLSAALAAASGGCQTFIGIEDVQGHLPAMDGQYLVGLHRVRANGDPERIRLVGSARLDPELRELDISMTMRSFTTGLTVSENSINDLVFPPESNEVEFDLSIDISQMAVETMMDEPDRTVTARMRMRLEGDYSFCAEAVGSPASQAAIGSVLVADLPNPLPGAMAFDVQCDNLQP